jgi:hypothetical protein
MASAPSGATASIIARDSEGNVTGISTPNYYHNIEAKRWGTCTPAGIVNVAVHIEAINADGSLVGIYDNPVDRTVTAFAQFIQANLLNTTPNSLSETLNNVSGVNKASSVSVNQAVTALVIVAGTTNTASAFADYKLGDGTTNTDYKTTSSYCNAGTVTAISSNTFTVTSTISNSSGNAISYAEVGLAATAATFQFLFCHDAPLTGGPFNVSNGGTLAVTYTFTFT